jgi:hypothetical protein
MFCVHLSVAKVLTEKGIDQVEKLTSGERGRKSLAISLFLCLYFQGSNWIKKDSRGKLVYAQPNGWIVSEGFLKCLKEFLDESALLSPTQ